MEDVQVSVKDEQSAALWLEMVRNINTDYRTAMTDTLENMMNMKDFADGTLVDEIYKYGTDLLNAAEKTFNAIDEIADTVNTVMKEVGAFADLLTGDIGRLISSLLG